MGIERLTSSLLMEANKESAEIVKAAETHVQKMVSEEQSKNEDLAKKAGAEVEQLLAGMRNERIAWARLEAKRILAEAKEDAIANSLEGFFASIEKSRSSAEYKEFMAAAAKSAANELGSGATIRVRTGEAKLVPKLKGMKVEEGLDALGGVLAESRDGKVMVNLTIETVFESKRDDLRRRVSEHLFKETGGGK